MSDRNAGGRPTDYTAELADEICAHIASGKSLDSYCKQPGTPELRSVYRWLNKHPEFCQSYARAREDQADTMADSIVDIADNEVDPNKARVRIDARKWVASKLKAKKYGDKVAHVGGDENDSPIRYSDEADAFTRRIAGIAPRVGAGSGTGESQH